MQSSKVLAVLRMTMGWIFLWAFFDKVFGFGFATEHGKAWIDGVSPTTGFLLKGTTGPLVGIFQALSGSVVVDWLFMVGLVCIGTALILGIAMRLAVYSGSLLLFLMWLAILLPHNNPIIDEHIVYILVLFTRMKCGADDAWGLGPWWKQLPLVRKYTMLR